MSLSAVVELLIIAHDCFSLTCNMEGIVRVLQTARHLSHSYLAPGEHYSLLVSSDPERAHAELSPGLGAVTAAGFRKTPEKAGAAFNRTWLQTSTSLDQNWNSLHII